MTIRKGLVTAAIGTVILLVSAAGIMQSGSHGPSKKQQTAQTIPLPSDNPISTEPLPTSEPLPSSAPDTTTPTTPSQSTGASISQLNSAIIQSQQQITTQMTACVQTKQQLYNQLVAQNKQLQILNAQYDVLNRALGNTKTQQQTDALEAQQKRVQDSIDKVNDVIFATQQALDEKISDCQYRISSLQDVQQGLEGKQNDAFNDLLQYELP